LLVGEKIAPFPRSPPVRKRIFVSALPQLPSTRKKFFSLFIQLSALLMKVKKCFTQLLAHLRKWERASPRVEK
jgi:hypothetical protein